VSSVRPKIWLWFLILVVGGILATLSVLRYVSYNAVMADLGNMSQAIWSVTRGHPLEYTPSDGSTPHFSRLGWHTELIYYPIALIYRLFPTPITLVIIQALWFVLGAPPVYALAQRRIGDSWGALAVAATYLFYPVAQTAVLWDFHGDTLAMPALLWALWALESGNDWAYGSWILLALSCKVYVAFAVMLVGALVFVKGQRAKGVVTVLGAGAWALFSVFVLRPQFAAQGGTNALASVQEYATFYFGQGATEVQASLFPRLLAAMVVFLPALPAVPKAAEWAMAALAMALPALLSSGPGPSYSPMYHHYALVVPFLVMATIEGIGGLKNKRLLLGRWRVLSERGLCGWHLLLAETVLLTLVFNGALVNGPLNPRFWTLGLGGEMAYRPTRRDHMKDLWLARNVPDEVPLASSVALAPHLANRRVLFTADGLAANLDSVTYGVFDALFDKILDAKGIVQDMSAIRLFIQDPRFILLSQTDGLLLFARSSEGRVSLLQEAECVTGSGISIAENFGGLVGLVSSDVQVTAPGKVTLRFEWVALGNLDDRPLLFAVSRIDGVPFSRMVHLPTVAILPTAEWPEGCVVGETFEVQLPDGLGPGTYRILTGWYDSSIPAAYATDERSRIGDEVVSGVIEVPSQ